MTLKATNSHKESCQVTLNNQQIATVLAALRYWQRFTKIEHRSASPHFEDFQDVVPLFDAEIDELCEEINSSTQHPIIPFVLEDAGDCECKVGGRIELWSRGIEVFVDCYGTKCMNPGHGFPVYIEVYNGELRVLVWSDINEEDPTHAITLEEAREAKRRLHI